MSTRKQIALAFSIGVPHYERLVEGIVEYARTNELQWSLAIMPENPTCSIQDLPEWPGDGIIANINTPVEGRLASTFKIPIVNISGVLTSSPIPRVHADNYAIGAAAAKHLMERGFRRFAYYGLQNVAFSDSRLRGFAETLQAEGYEVKHLLVPATFQVNTLNWNSLYQDLEAWLKSLSFPLGLFVVSDYRARIVLDVCHDIKMPIPMKLGVVAVDNEETICEHNSPSLSSIDRNDHDIGLNAAKMLDDLMNKRAGASDEIVIKPKGVVMRTTTDTLSVEDEKLAAAIEFIRNKFHEPITVDWVAHHISASRRWLENAFRIHTHISPYQYLCDYRIGQAKKMFAEKKKITIQEVAERSGFDNAKHFNSVFKRVLGESPTQYRKRRLHQGGDD